MTPPALVPGSAPAPDGPRDWHLAAATAAARHGDPLSPTAKRSLIAGMALAHLAGGWALLQVPALREAAGQIAPIVVEMIAPTPQAPVPTPPPPPPPPQVRPRRPPPPAPLLAAAPPPAEPPAPVFTAPPPLPLPVAVPAPAAAPTPPAPPVPSPATAPAAPRQVLLTDTDWIRAPQLEYPLGARRAREQGVVYVRALIDPRGVPRQVLLHKSSGFARLDQEALGKAVTARVKPRTDNGVPFEFWIVMPLEFALDD